MKFIADSVAFERDGWEIATITTNRNSLHALYLQTDDVVCLGVETPPGEMPALQSVEPILSAAEERKRQGGFEADYGIASMAAMAFDALGHVSGDLRRFANGWADEIDARIVHVFPCFRCELDPQWPAAKFVNAMRDIRDIFNLDRQPRPFLEIMMRGAAFPRPIVKWTTVPLTTALSYVPALENDPEAELNLRNIAGEVLTLNRETGWSTCRDAILAHACMR